MKFNKETFKYKALSIVRYLGDGFFYPFFALYLQSRGLLESKIGFILSISPLLGILLNPIYSRICKKPIHTKRVLMIVTIIEGMLIALISLSKDFYLISTLTFLMAIFGACHYPLMDALIALYCDQTEINYSSIRVYGSFAYIIATSVSGMICKYSFQISFFVSAFLFCLAGVFYLLIKRIEPKQEEAELVEEKPKGDLKIVFKNKEFIFFIIVYMFLHGLTKTTDNFFAVYLESRGIGAQGYGYIYSYFVFFEVITLIVLNKLIKKTINTYVLLFISSLCLLARIIPNYLYMNIYAIIVLSALRGIGYAIILHTSYAYVIKILGERLSTRGTMIMMLFYSLFVFSFNNIFGLIIEKHSYKTFYFICAIMVLATTVLIGIKILIDKKKNVRI